MTRDDTLAMPVSELAEVSARMMGLEIVANHAHCVVRVPTVRSVTTIWKPHVCHNDAREVADWVLPKLCNDELPTRAKLMLYKALEEVFDKLGNPDKSFDTSAWSIALHTPEQLTRAAMLAFVDAGGEI